jgi:hypothetical protein
MTDKIALTDGSGWFDLSTSISFSEDAYWDGSNMISAATGSQWEHEHLYWTRRGSWILACSSQWQGATDTYQKIDLHRAVRWLVSNGHEHVKGLPDEIQAAVYDEMESLEA